MIFLRKMKTKCAVKGCKSTGNKVDTYCVSVSKEFGKGVVMCEKCIEEAYEALNELKGRVPDEAATVEKEDSEAVNEAAADETETDEAAVLSSDEEKVQKTTKKRKKAVEEK